MLDARAILEEALAAAETVDDALLLFEAMARADVEWALRTARRIPIASERWGAMLSIAQAVAPSDPDRALRIVQRIRSKKARVQALHAVAEALAIAVANRIEGHAERQWALRSLVEPMAANHPQTAHKLAASLEWPEFRAEALRKVAAAYEATDAAKALEVSEEAVEAAKAQDDAHDIAHELVEIAETLASMNADRAFEVAEMALGYARQVEHPGARDCALGAVVRGVARFDEGRALEICRLIEDRYYYGVALTEIAAAVAETQPARAKELTAEAIRVTGEISDSNEQGIISTCVAKVLAKVDPQEAMLFALSLDRQDRPQGYALHTAARALAARDPDKTIELAMTAADPERRAGALTQVVWQVVENDPERALAVAQMIEAEPARTTAICDTVEWLAEVDPGRALEVARSPQDTHERVLALASLAEVLLEARGQG